MFENKVKNKSKSKSKNKNKRQISYSGVIHGVLLYLIKLSVKHQHYVKFLIPKM